MTKVQFLDINPFVSCCKDFEIVYHIPSSIKASSKHYIALCELLKSSQFTWVWAGKTVPLEQEGIVVKWRKGKVTFSNHVLPKLSDGREYYLMYCTEDGTILGESRPFHFTTESDDFSSIDLQSTPNDDVIMISAHGKKAPLTSSLQVTMHNINDDTASFEVISEQTYFDTVDREKEKEETEYFSQSVTDNCTAMQNNSYRHFESDLKEPRQKRQRRDPVYHTASPSTSGYSKEENIQVLKHERVALKEEISKLKDELAMKDNIIEKLENNNATLKEQVAFSNSAIKELFNHKETKLLEKEKTKLKDEPRPELGKFQQQLQMLSRDVNTLQAENKKLAQWLQNSTKSAASNLDEREHIDLGNF